MSAVRAGIHEELGRACAAGDVARARRLLNEGARPDVGDWPALKDAVAGGHVEALTCLLEAEPSQKAKDSALRLAASCREAVMARALLDEGARVNFDPEEVVPGEANEEIRRMLAAHMMAANLEDAMRGEEPHVRASGGGMQPL